VLSASRIRWVSLCELQALLGSSGELAGVEEIVLAERLLEQ
jgi:hypothetical protein